MSVEKVVFLERDQAAVEALEEGSKVRDVTLVSLDGLGAPEALRGSRFLLAFIGMRSDGGLLLEGLNEWNPKLILMAPPSAKRKGLEMVKGGAFGLLVKPFLPDEVSLLIDRALEEQRIHRELNRMRTLEGLSDLLLDRLRHAVKRADPSKKGDLYVFMMRCIERPLLEMVLEETGGNKMKAANILGINRNTLRSKIKELTLPTAR